MLCPRCQSSLISSVGSETNGERLQCRVCTNEWYDRLPEPVIPPEPARSQPSALVPLQAILAYCEERVLIHHNNARLAREASNPNRYYEELGSEMSAVVIGDFVRAQIKNLGGQ